MSAQVFPQVNHRLARTPLSPEATLKHERQSCVAGESWHFSENEIGRCGKSRITARLLTVSLALPRIALPLTRRASSLFRLLKNRLSAAIWRIQISPPSVQMSHTCIPHSHKCAICANAPVEVRCPLCFLTSLADSGYHLFLTTSLTTMTSRSPIESYCYADFSLHLFNILSWRGSYFHWHY